MAKVLPFDRRRAKPEPLVRRARRLTVDEATKAWGVDVRALAKAMARQDHETTQRLRKAGARAIAAEWAAITAERAVHRTRDPP